MAKFLGVLLSLAVFLWSCADTGDKKPNVAETKVEINDPSVGEEQNALKLNEGEKWEANAATNEAIGQMKQIVAGFHSHQKEGEQSYQGLGDELQARLEYIFNNCNMKGEAHDQLHNYLIPLIEDVEVIREVKAVDQGKELVGTIEQRLDLYYEYFY